MDQVGINPHNENLGAPYEDVHVVNNNNANHNAENDEHVEHASNDDGPDTAPNATVVLTNVVGMNEVAMDHDQPLVHDTIGPDYIPLDHEVAQQSLPPDASLVFIPNNTDMNYNEMPSTSTAQPVQTCNISVEGLSEHIAVLQD